MDPTVVAAIVGLGGTLIVAIISIYFNKKDLEQSTDYNERTLRHLQSEAYKEDIRRKLNEFYGPYQQRLATSKKLYDIFTENKPKEFRTLIALLGGQSLQGNDQVIYEEILGITNELEELRIKNSGLVDDPDLRDTLAQAGTHFRLIEHAYYGKIVGEADRFKGFVYPRKLNDMIDQKIQDLQTELKRLEGK